MHSHTKGYLLRHTSNIPRVRDVPAQKSPLIGPAGRLGAPHTQAGHRHMHINNSRRGGQV